MTEERVIKEGIMSLEFLSKYEKKNLIRGIIMENNHVKGILGSAKILNRLDSEEKIKLINKIYPQNNIVIYNNITKKEETYYNIPNENNLRERICIMVIFPAKFGGYSSSCQECGDDSCMLYYNCQNSKNDNQTR